eukprot:763360-Hanusia_phi.AAC.11
MESREPLNGGWTGAAVTPADSDRAGPGSFRSSGGLSPIRNRSEFPGPGVRHPAPGPARSAAGTRRRY